MFTRLKFLLKKAFLQSLILIFFLAKNSFAEVSLIRDAEIEKFLHNLADPIFSIAGLNPQNIKIYIVNDDSINAFVSGGQNVFINTGLIRKYNTPDALIGVVAHETGHIAGGHLARAGEGAAEAEKAMLLSYLLGIGAALGGSPDAGIGLIMGGSQSAQRLYMKFTRTQEEAADQYAIKYLDQMSYPADGLIKLLEFFESQMVGYKGQIDEYLLSHPVSRKRIDLIKERTKDKNFSNKKINQRLQKEMDIVRAKLEGFIENPEVTLAKYKDRNDEIANYIKSIAFFKKGMRPESLNLLDEIINQKKSLAKDKKEYDQSELGFLFELKGQILFESGNVEEALIAYNQALKLLSPQDAAQSKIAFSSAILALKSNDQDLLKLAIKRLEEAKQFEEENPFLFKQLASAYSRTNNEGRSLLALAEFNCLIGKKEKCRKYIKEAKEKLIKADKSELLRADDLLETAKEDKKSVE